MHSSSIRLGLRVHIIIYFLLTRPHHQLVHQHPSVCFLMIHWHLIVHFLLFQFRCQIGFSSISQHVSSWYRMVFLPKAWKSSWMLISQGAGTGMKHINVILHSHGMAISSSIWDVQSFGNHNSKLKLLSVQQKVNAWAYPVLSMK